MRKLVLVARLMALLMALSFLSAVAETAPPSGQVGPKGRKSIFEAALRGKPPEAPRIAKDAWISAFSDYAARGNVMLDGEFVKISPTKYAATAAAIEITLEATAKGEVISFALSLNTEEISGMMLSASLAYFPIAMRACVYANGNGQVAEELLDEMVRSLCPDITQAVVDGEEVFGSVEVWGIAYRLHILPEDFTIRFAPKAAAVPSAELAALPMTAQAWIAAFMGEAEAYGMPLGSFSYDPGLHTGQSCYSLIIEESSDHVLALAVFSEDGTAISSCALRLTSATLGSDELVNAVGTMRDVAGLMMGASDPDTTLDDAGDVYRALCPDLPAALLRHETVDSAYSLRGIRYALWAGFEEGAYYGSATGLSDGYIVDFTVGI